MSLEIKTSESAEIDTVFAELSKAHADRDADAIVAAYVPDAMICDLAPPLGHRGMNRDEVAAWLDTWDGPVLIDSRDRDLILQGDLAVSTALNRMRGRQGGTEQDLWFRTTTCLRRSEGHWRIVHEHTSVPFHMDGSYRAAVDLVPSD